MAKFITDLVVECIDDGKWKLMEDLVYQSDLIPAVTVPAGFETDFASVPRLPIVYMLFGDASHKAAVVHDYLYRYALVPRKVADAVFKEAMSVSGISWWRRNLMWSGVRMFGGMCYA